MLSRDEGLRLKPYRCTSGKLTIGVGRNLDDKGISEQEASALLRNDIFDCINAAYEILGEYCFDGLSAPRQHAVINLIFNLGKSGFSEFHNTIDAIRNNEWGKVAANLRASKWYKQVGKRAERVILLFESEKYAESYLK